MSKELEQRQSFADWAKIESYILDYSPDGFYSVVETHNAWLGWQAAQHQDHELISELVEDIRFIEKTIQWIVSEVGNFTNSSLNKAIILSLQKANQRLKESE